MTTSRRAEKKSGEKLPPTEIAKPVSKAVKLQQVLTWILEGNSEQLITEAIESTWPDESAKPLILAAVKNASKTAKAMRTKSADWCLLATHFLYQKQVELGEYAGAMRAIKQIAELTSGKKGAAPSAASPVTVNVGVQLDADERRSRILEIAERIRTGRVLVESPAR